MDTQHGQYVVAETVKPGVRVVRFTRPDLGIDLHRAASADEQQPYQEIRSLALADLQPADTLVLNLARVEHFPTPFYQILLRLREVAEKERNAKLVLCGVSPNIRRCFDVYKADKLFTFQPDEERAVRAAG